MSDKMPNQDPRNIIPPGYAAGGVVSSSNTYYSPNWSVPNYGGGYQVGSSGDEVSELRRILESMRTQMLGDTAFQHMKATSLEERLNQMEESILEIREDLREGGHPQITHLREQVEAWTAEADALRDRETKRLLAIQEIVDDLDAVDPDLMSRIKALKDI